jgi:glucan 1,3-beta-glucosidase
VTSPSCRKYLGRKLYNYGKENKSEICYSYFLKAIQWARKYGLRINLDFHAVPGSQNGWNHSGRLGTIGFLNGPMGYANAQRTLNYIRIIAEFISQPQYRDVVPIFGIINEPVGTTMGQDALSRL